MPSARRKKGRSRMGRSSRLSRRKISKRRFLPKRHSIASKTLIRQPTGAADSTFIKLTYTQALSFSPAALGVGFYVMRGNSIWDPDFTSTGGQPYFSDQWATIYQAYTVLGSSIRVQAFADAGTTAYQLNVTPSTGSANYTNLDHITEQPYTRYTVTQVNQASRAVKNYMSTNKILGVRKSQVFDDPNLSALLTANPASSWFWHINVASLSGAASQTYVVRMKITYFVRLFNRARPLESS